MVGSRGGELRAPIFNGENYEFWSIRMKTIFKSHGLWELVEKGIKSSDSKGADESDANKKEKEESSGDGKMILTEILMKDAKSFAQRLERHHENKTEKAFASLSVDSKSAKVIGNQNSKHQKNWKDKGKKWDNKLADGAKFFCKHCGKLHFGECRFKGKSKCYNYDKFGHIAKDCYSKKPVQQQLQYATQVTSTPTMFYVNNAADKRFMEDVWYLDSGCSNHMTGREDVLTDIDRSITAKVAMGTGQLVDVIGK
ncbi:uncharacterized protein LOC109950016 [Prunus persica]|uniref:uncharacterized protein LOC109950016 n=1 Tax=Prunus persica TaxID=3760 RepID=UPI0009AB8945|nr:uncharacterized protein LOC109950016 [Prunus persica]